MNEHIIHTAVTITTAILLKLVGLMMIKRMLIRMTSRNSF